MKRHCIRRRVVPLFKYWYTYYYSDVMSADVRAKVSKGT